MALKKRKKSVLRNILLIFGFFFILFCMVAVVYFSSNPKVINSKAAMTCYDDGDCDLGQICKNGVCKNIIPTISPKNPTKQPNPNQKPFNCSKRGTCMLKSTCTTDYIVGLTNCPTGKVCCIYGFNNKITCEERGGNCTSIPSSCRYGIIPNILCNNDPENPNKTRYCCAPNY